MISAARKNTADELSQNQGEKTKKTHVSRLQLGMYVSKLDRPWSETPFLMQGFLIETHDDIELLGELCTFVWIDAVIEGWGVTAGAETQVPGYRVRYINKLPPQHEHKQALGVYREARRLTKTLLDDVRLGGVIDGVEAKKTVDECVLSIIRNQDALVWMSKVREQDEYIAEHSLNVCILAICFGRYLGLDDLELRNLGLSGLLHDVGKLRIPAGTLNRRGDLSEREERLLRASPVHGRNLLMASPGVYRGAIDVAYSVCERVDGRGYPRGLKASNIPRFAKIIAIVNAYDEMTVPRHPEDAVTCTEALRSLFRLRGKAFDKNLVLAFIKTVGLYPPGTIVELCNGEVGLVLESNPRHQHLPKVITLLNCQKQAKRERLLDLSHIESGKLSRQFYIKQVHLDGSFGISLQEYKEKGLRFAR